MNVAAQNTPSYNPDTLSLQWEIIENNYGGKREFLSRFTLKNLAQTPLPATGWSLFFNLPRTIKPASVTGNVAITHINGDFYWLHPTGNFKALRWNDSVQIDFVADAWAISISDAPDGVYLVWDVAPEKGALLKNYTVKPSTTLKQFQRYAGDKIEPTTTESIFKQNERLRPIPEDSLIKIFPTPVHYKEGGERFVLHNNFIIESVNKDLFTAEAEYLKKELQSLFTAKKSNEESRIVLAKNNLTGDAYELLISSKEITISAGNRRGIFYGIQSLKSLIPPRSWQAPQDAVSIPAVAVVDAPRFKHRAFMLDVARNFQPKNQILKLLDLMALYKLNVFHFHFSDDEGWRLQIPGLPELTEVGAKRAHATTDDNFLHPSFGSGPDSLSSGSGYYTTDDFIAILKYATERHIQVIPEIETPGHARAAIAAMTVRYNRFLKTGNKAAAEQYLLYDLNDTSEYRSVQGWHRNVMNVAMPSTYAFLEKVVTEIVALYKKAGAPLHTIHFGGDEVPPGVWEGSPVAQQLIKTNPDVNHVNDLWYYYYGNVNKLLQKHGLFLYGWEEIALRKTTLDGAPVYIPNPDFVNQNFYTDVWNNVIGWGAEDLPYALANAGYKVVLSPVSNMYFDMAYQKDFNEPGYYWGGYVDVDKPFYFIPFDYYKNSKTDVHGNKISEQYFKGKERLTAYGQQNTIGLQGLLWSETIKSTDDLEYRLLPKLLGLAERAWAQSPVWATEQDSTIMNNLYLNQWLQFVNLVGHRELPRLDWYGGGFKYRIPTAGATIKNKAVHMNVQFPGLQIRYTTNGSEPTVQSTLYTAPVLIKGSFKIKVFAANGRSSRTVTLVNP